MTAENPLVRRADLADLDALAPLFDAYRQFYRKASDLELARRFLADRIRNRESIIFLALTGQAPAGFVQLYPTFSSGAAAPILILNDLFVDPAHRRKGLGARLMNAAVAYARESGAVRLTLSTEVTNVAGQALYEKLGWKRQDDFYVFNFPVAR